MTQVLVVGAGPVGLTAAVELARYGVRVRLIDKAAERSDKSKALVIWSRTLELIDRMGGGPNFLAAGHLGKGARIIAGGREIAHIDFAEAATPHPYALMLPQSETERLLEQQLEGFGGTLERRVELLDFAPQPNAVQVTLGHQDGRRERLEVDWLIGCDGAHSTVRHGLDKPFEGEAEPNDWVLADLHLAGVPKADDILVFWHASGLLALFPITGDRWRVVADAGRAGDGLPRPSPILAEVQALLDERGPRGVTASDPAWLASFRINERKVADYRSGRIFLAGDAAHVHSPAGGQGMNTGMQDAINLAWKLALVCRARARDPERLLASYSAERSPVGDEVLANAKRLTSIGLLQGSAAQFLRNHVAGLVLGLSRVRHKAVETLGELSIGYPKSPLNGGGLGHGPKPGERAPIRPAETRVGAGDTPRFALFAAPGPATTELIARFSDVLEIAPRAPFEAIGACLVRPDGYVAVASDRLEDAAGWLDRT